MEIRVISTNIRFENEADGENNWPSRKSIWQSSIKKRCPSIVCTQEGRQPQLKDAEATLENFKLSYPDRPWIKERMYPCIFINSEWEVLSSGDRWLSETPMVPGSVSFDSMFPRLMTFSHLKHRDNSIEIIVVNTHLDHLSTTTRAKQSKVLIDQLTHINSKKLPLILTGDFNESPEGDVRRNIDSSNIISIDPWKDLNKGCEGTHHRFTGSNSDTARIDWILASKEMKAIEAEIIKDNTNGKYPSDHFPIFATFEI